jgi:hypothetical protein
MSTPARFEAPYLQFFDDNGTPLNGGSIVVTLAGTGIPSPFYADALLAVPLGTTITLDAAGRIEAYLDADLAYKVVVKRANGTTVDTIDPYLAGGGTGAGADADDAPFPEWMKLLTW